MKRGFSAGADLRLRGAACQFLNSTISTPYSLGRAATYARPPRPPQCSGSSCARGRSRLDIHDIKISLYQMPITSDQTVEVLRAAGEATRLRILALLAREELPVLD